MWRQSKHRRKTTLDADEGFGDAGSVGSDSGCQTSSMETRHSKVPLHHGNGDRNEEASGPESFVELDNLLENIAADGNVPNAPQRRRNHLVVERTSKSNYSTSYGRTLYHGSSNGSVSKKSVPLKRRQQHMQRPSVGPCHLVGFSQRVGIKGVLGILLFVLMVVLRFASDETFAKHNDPKEALERFKSRFKRRIVDESLSIEELPLRGSVNSEEDEQNGDAARETIQLEADNAQTLQDAETTPIKGKDDVNHMTPDRNDIYLVNEAPILKLDHRNQASLQQQGIADLIEDILPQHLRDSLGDVTEPFNKTRDTPFFFHIPRSGGTVLSDIMTHCLNLASASNIGITEGKGELQTLQVNKYQDQGKYVNVDTSSNAGIERARQLGLTKSGLADVITSHRFHEASHLFDSTYRGRAFGIFRHPVQRAVSMFYYLQMADWEPTYDPELATMTLEEYAVSQKAESNWLTRTLTTKFTGGLTEHHVNLAKEILRRKIMVGLMDKFDESLKRFELYFGWWEDRVQKDFARLIDCQESRKGDASSRNEVTHPMPEKESAAFKLLSRLNWADVIVYDYAVRLFSDQQNLVNPKKFKS